MTKQTFSVRQFYMLSSSHKRIPFEKAFYSKWAKIYSYWILHDSQRISVSLMFFLLWQANFYSKQANSCLFWVFVFVFLIMRIKNLQCMGYFISWEMHGFSYNFFITWDNSTKLILRRKPEISIPIMLTIAFTIAVWNVSLDF